MRLLCFSIYTDVDECADPSKNNCSLNANCTDTIGSYDCTCQIGYSGNGNTCDGTYAWLCAVADLAVTYIHTRVCGCVVLSLHNAPLIRRC